MATLATLLIFFIQMLLDRLFIDKKGFELAFKKEIIDALPFRVKKPLQKRNVCT